jgi:hypothetical protein
MREKEHFKISDAEAAFPVPVIEVFVILNKIIFPSESYLQEYFGLDKGVL